jgi:DNA repair protein SbcD/Mre11
MSNAIPFSFIHCADLHLDSPFEGIHAVAPDIAAMLREATFQAFEQIIDLAVKAPVDFVIVAGDVHDGENRSLRAQLRFRDALRKAGEAGIQSFIAHGNHDSLAGWEAHLNLPDMVKRFGGQGVECFPVQRQGATLAYLHGMSYPVREVKTNLATGFVRHPDAPFAIGVLHCNVGGDPNHDNYAPCSLEDLRAAGMDYWALGHIHAQRILQPQDPCIVYSGNPQGRNWREMGPRGCYLVQVDGARRITPTFVATDVLRWFIQDLDIGELSTWDDLLDDLMRVREDARARAEGRAAIMRLNLVGRGDLHRELARKIDLERDLAEPLREGEPGRSDFVWVEAIRNRTRPPLDWPSAARSRISSVIFLAPPRTSAPRTTPGRKCGQSWHSARKSGSSPGPWHILRTRNCWRFSMTPRPWGWTCYSPRNLNGSVHYRKMLRCM